MSESKSTTEWRTITVQDSRGPVPVTHVLAIEIVRSHLFLNETTPPRLESASIELAAFLVSDDSRPLVITRMGGSYRHGLPAEYTLTGGNMVVVEAYRGLHIGTYLQNEVVRWALKIGLPGRIKPIKVASDDALTEAERDRRNRFYMQFGIRFQWTPDTPLACSGGNSLHTLMLSDVHTVDVIEGVAASPVEAALSHYVRRASRAEQQLAESRERHRTQREVHDVERRHWRVIASIGAGAALVALVLAAVICRFH
jgi:GNAT superfamily N-acetyltransferase